MHASLTHRKQSAEHLHILKLGTTAQKQRHAVVRGVLKMTQLIRQDAIRKLQ